MPPSALTVVGPDFNQLSIDITDYDAADQVALLLAISGNSLGGAVIKCREYLCSESWTHSLGELREAAGDLADVYRVPVNCGLDLLLGGLDIFSTLTQSTTVKTKGLLARADRSMVALPMAELQRSDTIRAICNTLDSATLQQTQEDARICVLALSHSAGSNVSSGDDELDPALVDRLAFTIELHDNSELYALDDPMVGNATKLDTKALVKLLPVASSRLPRVTFSEKHLKVLCELAKSLEIDSLRAQLFALRVARCAAALAAREKVADSDIEVAVKLCFLWRAKSMPTSEEDSGQQADHSPSQDSSPESESEQPKDSETDQYDENNTDVDNHSKNEHEQLNDESEQIEKITATLPAGLLDALAQRLKASQPSGRSSGKSGQKKKSVQRGREIGTEKYQNGSGQKINVVATLRNAAPWQKHRRSQVEKSNQKTRIRPIILPQDIRGTRYLQSTQTVTVFAVDASGSAAAKRLNEAKGAVELLLAECYVRRDEVALIVFQGASARLVLPPTRSLVRARRELIQLPSGGGTPLASALNCANDVCRDVMRAGNTAVLCLLTDGRANVDRDGIGGRARAAEQALQSAQMISAGGTRSLVIDIAARPSSFAAELASSLNGQYLALPRADARQISSAVNHASASTNKAAPVHRVS